MKKRGLVLLGIVFFLAISIISTALDPAGTIVALQGKVFAGRGGKLIPLKFKDPVFTGDVIISEKGGKAKILFNNESTATIAENSKLEIRQAQGSKDSKNRSTVINLTGGIGRFVAGKKFLDPGSKFEVTTPTAVAGVRSTDFFVIFLGGKSIIVTVEGGIGASNILPQFFKEVLVLANFQTDIERDGFAKEPFLADRKFLEELIKATRILRSVTKQDIIIISSKALEELLKRATDETYIVLASALGMTNFLSDLDKFVFQNSVSLAATSSWGNRPLDFTGAFTGGVFGWYFGSCECGFSITSLTGSVNSSPITSGGSVIGTHYDYMASSSVTGGTFSGRAQFTGGQYVGNVTGSIIGQIFSGSVNEKLVFSGRLTADKTGKIGTVTFTGGQLYNESGSPVSSTVTGGSINFRK